MCWGGLEWAGRGEWGEKGNISNTFNNKEFKKNFLILETEIIMNT